MTTVVVLGMHRSGTSLVSSMLHKMGVNMGEVLIPPDDNNLHGYWEDDAVLVLNKAILASLDSDWRKIVTRKQIESARKKYLPKLKKFVAAKETKDISRLLWGFKDPRTCLTIWLWHDVLTAPRYVIVRRQKRDVIHSLKRAYGKGNWFDLIKHYEQHVRAFVGLNKNLQVHYVSYDDLISDDSFAISATVGLASFVGTPGQARQALSMVRKKK